MSVLCDYSFPDHEIVSQLSKLPCVKEVERVNGPYDIVMKLFDANMNIIKESIGKHMTRIRGIQSTLTLMAVVVNPSFLCFNNNESE
jgi:DNA-binding Lrp family transcriptional regulator